MARYIDVDKISSYIRENFSIDKTKNADICFAFIDLMNWLDDQPAAEVEEVKNGEWIQGIPYRCSNCGKPAPEEKNTSEEYSCWLSDYCPHCGVKMGAKMDGGKI